MSGLFLKDIIAGVITEAEKKPFYANRDSMIVWLCDCVIVSVILLFLRMSICVYKKFFSIILML